MKLTKSILLILIISVTGISVSAQMAADSADIYILQTPVENTSLPENRTELNKPLFLERNEIRSVLLFYPEQDSLLDSYNQEDFQWGSDEFIRESEAEFMMPVEPGPEADSDAETSGRLEELLGDMISGQGEQTSGSENGSDDEAVEAFRKAFEAVMREEKATEEEKKSPPMIYGDVDGIVLDETRSKTGRDFYNAFYNAWSKLEGKENSVVRIAEKPGPGMGSMVFVEVDHEEIFELRLRPGDQRTKQAGDVAAVRTISYLEEKINTQTIY